MAVYAMCQKVCVTKYHGVKAGNRYFHPYEEGFKRCTHCDIFIKIDGVLCPCCHERLRIVPKMKKYKDRLSYREIRN